ncbi:hypothetical protein BDR03DRAFT_984387 [Suillus americanus]|nr:hypothetical protein BDR03DRAFT_984387 [Suillus americanus]
MTTTNMGNRKSQEEFYIDSLIFLENRRDVHQIFYFAGRYLPFALIGIPRYTKRNRLPYTLVMQQSDSQALTFLSGRCSLLVSEHLSRIILGHWPLVLQGVLLTSVWHPVLAWGLRAKADGAPTRLAVMFSDGLMYFFIAYVCVQLAATMMVLDLNVITSVIFNVQAAVASTIMAPHVVRRLTNFQTSAPEIISFKLPRKNSDIPLKNINGSLYNAVTTPNITVSSTLRWTMLALTSRDIYGTSHHVLGSQPIQVIGARPNRLDVFDRPVIAFLTEQFLVLSQIIHLKWLQ